MDIIKSGIPGLDELLNGGFPSGHSILLTGGPGTGKSIFSIQFLLHGAMNENEPGLLVTLEEPYESIVNNMSIFGFNLEKLIKEEKIAIVDAAPIRFHDPKTGDPDFLITKKPHPILGERKFGINELISLIHEERRRIGAKRLVIDSLTTLMLYDTDNFQLRQNILTMVKSMKISGLTSIFITELHSDEKTAQFGVEPFLTEGFILLRMVRKGNTRIRAIDLIKMRGINHSMESTRFGIASKGVEIYPGERIYREDE